MRVVIEVVAYLESFHQLSALPDMVKVQVSEAAFNFSGDRRSISSLQRFLMSSSLAVLVYIPTTFVSIAGGGMFFYWMIGVVSVLQQQIDLTSAHMSGASAGALASVLAACGVDVRHAAEHAFQLSIDEKLWDRKLKLALVWGRLIRQWLWDLLPENAAELCNGRVHLFVLELPAFHTGLQFKRVPVTDFRDKADLIDCALASVHIPVFMTGHIWTEFRGSRCVDGSINADRLALNIDPRRHTLYVDPYEDPEMKERGSRFLELAGESPGPEGTWEWIEYMMNRGEEHAHKITSAGHLEPWIRKANCLEPGTLI